MSSLTRSGLVQEAVGQNSVRFDGWRDQGGYSPATQAAMQAAEELDPGALELRMALLARAIEHEIIPRLMLAHKSTDACIAGPAIADQQVGPQDVRAFATLVLSPDENLAQACVDAMRMRGILIETIYLDLLAPVARYLGELWEQDLCDFTEVTIGLGRLHSVLRELSPAFSQNSDRPTNGRRVLLLPAPGEQHTFGLVMVSEFFRRDGWDVAGGPWEAGADPVLMVKREWFDVVGFSLASEQHLDDLGDCISDVRKAALNPGLGIIVGGPAFAANPGYGARVFADAVVDNGSKAPALAENLVAKHGARG